MTNQEYYDSIPHEVLQRHIEVEGERFSIDTFLHINLLEEDVIHISQEEAQQIVDLDFGDSVFIHLSNIIRIDETTEPDGKIIQVDNATGWSQTGLLTNSPLKDDIDEERITKLEVGEEFEDNFIAFKRLQ